MGLVAIGKVLGVGGGREMIGFQVAPSGTEDPGEKPEVCHLMGGGPSFPPFSSMGLWTLLFSLTASC